MRFTVKVISLFALTLCYTTVAIKFECTYKIDNYISHCRIIDLLVLDRDIGVTVLKVGNAEITKLTIDRDVETEFVPTRICEGLRYLQQISINGKNIMYIFRDVFKKCDHVTSLFIEGTRISFIPNDTFADLTNLQDLRMDGNHVNYLPYNLLENNRKIIMFSMNNNQLKVINMKFPSTITNVQLKNNTCIDRIMNNDVDTFNDEIARKCSASVDSIKTILSYVYEVKTDSSCDYNKTDKMLKQIMREKAYLKFRERLGDQPPPKLPSNWFQNVLNFFRN